MNAADLAARVDFAKALARGAGALALRYSGGKSPALDDAFGHA